jgi:hypothetical protein
MPRNDPPGVDLSAGGAAFYVAGGTMRHDALSYVERAADRELYQGLKAGEFCYVLHARQMGKSSLMARTAIRLKEEGAQVVVLDLTGLGQNLSAEQWYAGLLGDLGQQLDLEEELEAFWKARTHLGPLRAFIQAIEHVVLAHGKAQSAERRAREANGGEGNPPDRRAADALREQGEQPDALRSALWALPTRRVVIFIDEIDAVRSLPFSTDELFAAIRECYNRRTRDPQYERLTFCLLGVASPSDLIRDVRTTPFNIGRRIELTDFTEEEARPLAIGLEVGDVSAPGRSVKEAQALLKRILYWTGGHPYLTQRLCQAVAEDRTAHDDAGLDRLCEELFLTRAAHEKDDNLIFVRERLLKSGEDIAALLQLYGQVWRSRRVRDDDTNSLCSLLKLSGVAAARDAGHSTRDMRYRRRRMGRGPAPVAHRTSRIAHPATLQVRNRIYARVFDREWIAARMPDAERRRQRAAFCRRLMAAAGIQLAPVLLLAAGAGLFYLHTRVIVVSRSGPYTRLSEAVRRAWPWTEIRLRPGIYTESIPIRGPVSIVGEGGSRDRIVLESAGAPCVELLAERAAIQGFTLSGLTGDTNQPAIEVWHGRLTMTDCAIASNGPACVRVSGPTASVDLDRCRLGRSAATGLSVMPRASARLWNTEVSGCSGTGIRVEGGTASIWGGVVNDNATGLRVLAGGRCDARRCHFEANIEQGVEVLLPRSQVTLDHCWVRNNRSSGVYVYAEARATLLPGTRVDGNGYTASFGERSPGIDVRNGAFVEASGCTISGNALAGVWIGKTRGKEDSFIPIGSRRAEAHLASCTIAGNGRVAVEVEPGGTVQAVQTVLRGSPKAVWVHPGATGSVLEDCVRAGAIDPGSDPLRLLLERVAP